MEFAPDLAQRLVDALHSAHGEHPGHRAAHAKGSCARGTFTATAEAASLTLAAHMQGDAVPATVRFSNGSGIPTLPDYARGDGRGMAVKLDVGGRNHDMVALSLPLFFVRDPESFMEFLAATRPDPATRQPDLALVGAFLERHPETRAALDAAMGAELPASYLQVRYNGIHAFRLTNAKGEGRWARYRWEPEAGEATATSEEARSGGREYLQDQLVARLAEGPAAMRLVFRMARAGDPLTDPTAPWPEDREAIIAGRLQIAQAEASEVCDALVFDPTNVVDGIECSEDPILHARSVAYARSFTARRGFTPPSTQPRNAGPVDAGARALEDSTDLPAGSLWAVEVEGGRVAVANVAGTLHAFQDSCTHRGCSLSEGTLEGSLVTCPCHGSQFDVTTGEVRRGPARESVKVLGRRRAGPGGDPALL